MKRRILSILLASIMLLSLLPVTALAEDSTLEEPKLMYRYMDWSNDQDGWYAPEEYPLETFLRVESGNPCPVQFYYGTTESYTEVDFSDLTFPSIMRAYMRSGALWVEGAVFEGSGTITYTKGDVTASLNVEACQPSYGIYSSSVASAETFLGRTIDVNPTNTVFYIVANQDYTISPIEIILDYQTGQNLIDHVQVTYAGDGSYAKFQLDADNLPVPGSYAVLIPQEWGEWHLEFDVTRSDLPVLNAPTELTWHKLYTPISHDDGETWEMMCETRMGSMSFRADVLPECWFYLELYSAADGYTNPIHDTTWYFSGLEGADYFSITDFLDREFPSGTYKFRVKALGHGTGYSDSPWSEFSPAWTYTVPSAQLSAPDASKFFWSEENGYHVANWQHTGEAGTGYYEVEWFYHNGRDFEMLGFDTYNVDRVLHSDASGICSTILPDWILNEFGAEKVRYRIRAIPADINEYCSSQWPDFSPVLDVSATFTDVPADSWFARAVDWAVENKITAGTSATTFSPDAPCTRAQVVSFLWRAAGKPEPTTASGFSDVAEDAWFAKAVDWAVENKITAGTSATTFSPEDTCTRAQIVSFLWRFAGKPAADGAANPFQDVLDGEYYYGAVLWAVENKITAGTSATTFSPEAPCTRAQIVSFLYRYLG